MKLGITKRYRNKQKSMILKGKKSFHNIRLNSRKVKKTKLFRIYITDTDIDQNIIPHVSCKMTAS